MVLPLGELKRNSCINNILILNILSGSKHFGVCLYRFFAECDKKLTRFTNKKDKNLSAYDIICVNDRTAQGMNHYVRDVLFIAKGYEFPYLIWCLIMHPYCDHNISIRNIHSTGQLTCITLTIPTQAFTTQTIPTWTFPTTDITHRNFTHINSICHEWFFLVLNSEYSSTRSSIPWLLVFRSSGI